MIINHNRFKLKAHNVDKVLIVEKSLGHPHILFVKYGSL